MIGCGSLPEGNALSDCWSESGCLCHATLVGHRSNEGCEQVAHDNGCGVGHSGCYVWQAMEVEAVVDIGWLGQGCHVGPLGSAVVGAIGVVVHVHNHGTFL